MKKSVKFENITYNDLTKPEFQVEFEKISFEEFKKSCKKLLSVTDEDICRELYDSVRLPRT